MKEIINTIVQDKHGVLIRVYIQPGSRKNLIVGIHQGIPPRIKLKIKSPPIDGKANLALIDFMSELLNIPKKKIEIIRGHKSKQKDLLIIEDFKKIILQIESTFKQFIESVDR